MTHRTITASLVVLSLTLVSTFQLSRSANASAEGQSASEPKVKSATEHDERMGWFREARFGMFIHWGLYSTAAGAWDSKPVDGRSSWMQRTAQSPLKEYMKLRKNFTAAKFDADAYVRSLKPSILIDNRVDKGRSGMEGLTRKGDYAGDFGTPEQQIPPTGLAGIDWETCMTVNNTWGYKRQDTAWKSTDMLLHQLIDCASKGGNYLLNIGPTADGTIPAPCPQQLREIGDWLRVNGEAIHGTTANPFAQHIDWGRCTTGKLCAGAMPLYLHLFKWPDDGKLTVPPMENVIHGAYLLDDLQRTALPLERHDGKSIVTLGNQRPSNRAIVVVLQVEGKPTPTAAKTELQTGATGEARISTIPFAT